MKKEKTTAIVISVISVVAIVSLAIALGFTGAGLKRSNEKLDGVYQKSYYSAANSLSDIEMKLAKIRVLSGRDLKRSMLYDIWRESDIAASELSLLGTENEDSGKIIKYLNQLGDYCAYLATKLKISDLTEGERENLDKLYEISKELNSAISDAREKLVSGDKIDGKILSDNSLFDGILKDHSSIEYPEMIYDGPFSDGLSDRETKFLTGKEEISEDQGLEKVRQFFPQAENIRAIGEGSSEIPAYLYEFELGRNTGVAQITKVGGYVAMYDAYCEITDPTLGEDECVARADEYISALGYGDMKAVWVCNNNSTVYINYACVKDGIILYPDLIKVKICSQTGDLIGLEAQNYLYNHTERELTMPEKHAKISENLHEESRAYCLIPTEFNTEILAEEVVVVSDGMTFYLYFDPESGEELRAMAVIDEDGKLLV